MALLGKCTTCAGVDSDGCAFNSMEVKHNDCFSVALVRDYGLAAISRQVHQAWDFVNLYSQNLSRALNDEFEFLVRIELQPQQDAKPGTQWC